MSARALGLRGQDARRRHPVFSWTWLDALPGIREGVGAFAVFCAAEALLAPPAHGAHGAHGAGGGAHGEGAHAAPAHGAAKGAGAGH